ncbi:hypothetical protein WK53_17895 [Burkholderia ubonensis]|uniref:Methyl-accepting transducer domain-containing protein n=1 Tax=Burkholderia ubonensis TaxID=101571 RepID=A0AAW3MYX9_9BURK|nr:hypothetical protein WK53_17895 [Burkholderia ubonensis]
MNGRLIDRQLVDDRGHHRHHRRHRVPFQTNIFALNAAVEAARGANRDAVSRSSRARPATRRATSRRQSRA